MSILQVSRKLCLVVASFALPRTGLAAKDDYRDDRKACGKWYPSEVENICHHNFPSATSEKTWIMLFSSNHCIECVKVQSTFVDWAKKLQQDPSIRVGVVNCYYQKNYKTLCHPRFEVQALPTLRIIRKGEWKNDGKQRHDVTDINNQIISYALSSSECPAEQEPLIENTPLVPLCQTRFPGSDTITTWMVVYHSKNSDASLFKAARQVALELGNVENIELTEDEKTWQSLKKKDRLDLISKQYSVKLQMPRQGWPLGSGALVYMGAICCDCNSNEEGFCKQMMNGYTGPLPAIGWSQNGQQKNIEFLVQTPWALMEYAMIQLGFAFKSPVEL